MPSFILRKLDPEFWARVQAKAAAEGTTVKAVILRLLASWLGVLTVLATITCAYDVPPPPVLVLPPRPGIPSRMDLNASPGMGAESGMGRISARVFDAYAAGLPNQTVTFSVSVGTLAAEQTATDQQGYALTTMTAPPGSVTVGASVAAPFGPIEATTRIAIQALPPPAGNTNPGTPPNPTPSPPTPSPPTPVPPTPNPPVPPGPAPSNVEYRITGTATHCSATYENSTGGTDQRGVSVPFSYSWNGAQTGDFLYISCQIDTATDRGDILVAIYKNGVLYRSATAVGFPSIATASGSY
jgi:Bacterial Ig-like domain (group 1)